MGRSYSDAAEAARRGGIIDRADVQAWQVKQDLQRFLQIENASSRGGQELLNRTVDAAMSQQVKDAYGHNAGRRENLKVWEDTHGNIMRHNTETGNRSKLVDKSERGL